MLKIDIEKKTNYLWVNMEGKLINEEDGKKISNQIIHEISTKYNTVIINLLNLNYINSSGFNNFLKILTSSRNLGGDTILCNANSLIKKLLITTKLNTIFNVQSEIENLEDFLNKINMAVDVLLGLQWGDEGKGKIVDVLTPNYDIIARFQGGPNAGHTLEFEGIKHVLHTIPSGIFRNNVINVIGNGVVIDPVILKKEIEQLEKLNVNVKKNY